MRRELKAVLYLFLCIALVFIPNSAPFVFVEATQINDPADSLSLSVDEIMAFEKIESMKTEYANAYQTADDQITYVVDTNKVNYRDEHGIWRSVDDEIVPIIDNNYLYQNKANDFRASFGLTHDSRVLSRIKKDNYTVEFVFQADQSVLLDSMNELDRLDVEYLAKLNNQSNSIVYKNVLPNTDFAYTVKGDQLKEDIIFYAKTDITDINYMFVVDNLSFMKESIECVGYNEDTGEETVSTVDTGVFYDLADSDQEVFRLSEFVLYDANGKCSGPLIWDYNNIGGTHYLKLHLDQDFMNDESVCYPIILDPTVQGPSVTFDTFASRTYPNSNYYLNDYLRTGKDSTYGIRRTFIKWTLPLIDNEYPITTAQVQLKKYTSAGSTNLNALKINSSWSSSTLTWWNSPNCDTDHQVTTSSWSGDWQIMDVSMIMRRWDCGLYTNYGVKIFDDTEDNTSVWATFYSSDYDTTSYNPKLVINLETGSSTWDIWESGGYNDNYIEIHNLMSKYSDQFTPALYAWTNSAANCYITENPAADNYVIVVNDPEDWYGSFGMSYDPVEHFAITLNEHYIDENAEWDGLARDVLIHELGHALWLYDQQYEQYCIMGYNRDRNSMMYPSLSDITGVNNMWP